MPINTVTGAQPNNPGLLGPLNLPIGPLPAMQMPGEIAKTVPVMANFMWLLGQINDIITIINNGAPITVEDEGVVLSRFITTLDFRGAGVTASALNSNSTLATITIPGGGGGGGSGKPIFFGIDPPPVPTDWIAWWNTEEGALKIWYTVPEGDPDSDQWVDAMPARTGAPGSGGSNAPADAQYLVLALDAVLTNERVLTPGSGVTFLDGGPGSTLTVSVTSGFASFVPTFIAVTDIFTVPADQQALYAQNIDVEGTLDVEGILIEVD